MKVLIQVAMLGTLFWMLLPRVVDAQSRGDAVRPVKVFILAGQSNMEGKAKVSLLEKQIEQPANKAEFAHLHEGGKFVERDDVFVKFLGRSGSLTVGFGSPNCIGPELQFGWVMGDHFEEPVLLIKTAWGGKSLYRDFRPPSAGAPDPDLTKKQLENAKKRNPDATLKDIENSYGTYYRAMLKEIEQALAEIDQLVPADVSPAGYELAGFVWFQGWNDMVNPDFVDAYTENMAHFIRDVRRDLNQPDLPFVVGVLGVGGTKEEKPNPKKDKFKRNQAAVGELKEFQGNVAIVHTDQLWDWEADAVFKKGWKQNLEAWEAVGSDRPYHYLGSVKCYNRIGGAFAESMLGLLDQSPEAPAARLIDSAEVPVNFRTENLVAWCIVPFDAKNRSPEDRAEMVRQLGLMRVAYDWREKHVPEFEREILAYQQNGIEYFAFWGWHESMEALIRKYQIQPQIWEMFRGQLPGDDDEENVRFVAKSFSPLAQKAKSLGLKFGIYNHGGWAGEPDNLVAVCEYLREHYQLDNVGIVYNFHHAHGDMANFEKTFLAMKPYLMCLNLNGMADPSTVDGQAQRNKILPIGTGKHETGMIKAVIASGYQGPIGILGHQAEMDAAESVGSNVRGLKKMFGKRD